jgi:hypothetical protein
MFEDIFSAYLGSQIGKLGSYQADSDRRLTSTSEKLQALEHRYDRMRLVTNALWQLLKEHTGLTDADLKRFIEKVDLLDGKLDGTMARTTGAINCPSCSRPVLKSAIRCSFCGTTITSGDAFQST